VAPEVPLASRCSLWKQPPGLRLEAQRMIHQNNSVIKAKQKSPFAIRLKSFGDHELLDWANTYRPR
jgi:hypothetical protein